MCAVCVERSCGVDCETAHGERERERERERELCRMAGHCWTAVKVVDV